MVIYNKTKVINLKIRMYMKTIYGYIGILIAVCLLQACESDLDKAYYSDGQAQPAVLEALPETYTINPAATK